MEKQENTSVAKENTAIDSTETVVSSESFIETFERNIKELNQNLAKKNKAELAKWVKFSEEMGSSYNIGIFVEDTVEKMLIALNYICFLKEYLGNGNYAITLFHKPCATDLGSVIKEGLIDKYFSINLKTLTEKKIINKYDLFINISTYPRIMVLNSSSTVSQMPALVDYIMAIKKFELVYDRYEKVDSIEAQFNILFSLKNKNLVDKLDVSEFLNIEKKSKYKIDIDEKLVPIILNKYGITGEYIVLVDEFSEKYGISDNRMWPVEYFEILTRKIKEKYPDLKIVQIQTNNTDLILDEEKDKCQIQGTDIYIDNASVSEQIALLSKAKILISNDSSCVHLRHFIDENLKSIVIYTSTNNLMHSYENNENFRGEKCIYPCEGLYCDWERKCKHTPRRTCQWEITPNMILEKI